jgi:hypothetical protein
MHSILFKKTGVTPGGRGLPSLPRWAPARAARRVAATVVGPPLFSCGAGQRGWLVAAEEAAASMAAAGRGAARAGRTSPFPVPRRQRSGARARRPRTLPLARSPASTRSPAPPSPSPSRPPQASSLPLKAARHLAGRAQRPSRSTTRMRWSARTAWHRHRRAPALSQLARHVGRAYALHLAGHDLSANPFREAAMAEEQRSSGVRVCVTGSVGFISSWLSSERLSHAPEHRCASSPLPWRLITSIQVKEWIGSCSCLPGSNIPIKFRVRDRDEDKQA